MVDPVCVFLEQVKACLRQCTRISSDSYNDYTRVNNLQIKLRSIIDSLTTCVQGSRNPVSHSTVELLKYCESVLIWLGTVLVRDFRRNHNAPSQTFPRRTITTGRPGRPRVQLDLRTVEYLSRINFKYPQIATMFNVSLSLVKKICRKYDFHKTRFRCGMDRATVAVAEQIRTHRNYGARLISAALETKFQRYEVDYRVPLQTVQIIMKRLDPLAVDHRLTKVRHRRKYCVKRALSLWHIDGHHKLIMWKFVIHGGIDGYSRMVVFCHCSTNNRADTVMTLFQKAVINFGLPSRVRGDHGGENTEVAKFMIRKRGANRGSFLYGPSVHNQRIERYWREVFSYVSYGFYTHFQRMEEMGYLSRDSPADLKALHYIYLPRINKALYELSEHWNSHRCRTERNFTPLQMMTTSILKHASEIEGDGDIYSRLTLDEWYNPCDTVDAVLAKLNSIVECDDSTLGLTFRQWNALRLAVPTPLQDDGCEGVTLYMAARNITHTVQ